MWGATKIGSVARIMIVAVYSGGTVEVLKLALWRTPAASAPRPLAIGDDSAVELRKLRIYIADMDVGSPLARFHSARMAIRRTREWIV